MTAEPQREFETEDIFVNVGPQHPATHGVFRMVLEVDGEVVRELVPHLGYMHRGGEKLCETMDYRQGIGYMDRTEYLGNFNAELSYVMAVEKLAGLEVPERAQWLRMILVELNRISSHFMFAGAFGVDLGILGTSFTYAFRGREAILDFFEEITGERLMYAYFRAGGLAWEVTDNFEERVPEVLAATRQTIDDLENLMSFSEIFQARTRGIGVLSAADAIEWGVSGPVMRASGVPMDLRRDEPYLFYDQINPSCHRCARRHLRPLPVPHRRDARVGQDRRAMPRARATRPDHARAHVPPAPHAPRRGVPADRGPTRRVRHLPRQHRGKPSVSLQDPEFVVLQPAGAERHVHRALRVRRHCGPRVPRYRRLRVGSLSRGHPGSVPS